jgi:MFS family permease
VSVAETSRTSSPLWTKRNRAATTGMLVLITIAAFEHLGVSTAMPRMLADLHGAALYSWPFTSFLAASVIATVLSGRACDRFGPGPALLLGPALFLAGLIVAGTATGMAQLLTGRALQGLGLGTQIVAIYVLVALIHAERDRPAAFGLLAAAWVVPSVIGPTAAGLITEHWGWRWVFLALCPIALLGVLLLVPTVRALPPSRPNATKRRGVPLGAVAAGVGISALTWGAQHPSTGGLLIGLAGLALLVPALRVLMPKGTVRAKAGLPAVILGRGIFAGAFFAVEAYLPLTLTAVHGYSPALAGLPLTVGALGWSLASAFQGRKPDVSRVVLVRTGFLLVAIGLAATALVGPHWPLGWVAALTWLVAGAGMGLAIPSLTVLTMRHAAEDQRGFASSALQVSDMLGSALAVGIGGALLGALASAAHPSAAVVPLDLAMSAVALAGIAVTRRMG